ncbi:MAG: glutamate--tRNA ligase [Gemmatimonadota bacterium]|nr:glutamate--tRNA ligase [Gemmatimonadota bacterium]MDE2984821.1 glutamate--tRNA ligase [Gemmatimonadota bacterium]
MRLRFAPSPTGYLHVGGARTALFNWLLARSRGGTFVLRIEDTDRDRSRPEHVEAILNGLAWLGLDWDEGPYFQAAGVERHRADALRLLAAGRAYRDFTPREEFERARDAAVAAGGGAVTRLSRELATRVPPAEQERRAAAGDPFAIRFLVPDGTTSWRDLVHGDTRFANAEIDDFVILRSDGTPTYNLAVVSDDADTAITHVLRGDDHISNTPKQILLYEALGHPVPAFGHLPMILGPDGKRLSKRHGARAVDAFEAEGVLADAMVNFLALLGWSPGTDEELMSQDELTRRFSLERVLRKGSVFDPAKLFWMNGQYMARMVPGELTAALREALDRDGVAPDDIVLDEEAFAHMAAALAPRSRTFTEMARLSRPYIGPIRDYDPKATRKNWYRDPAATMRVLSAVRDRLTATPWEPDALESELRALAGELGVGAGKVFQPLRVALTGVAASPGIFDVLLILGRERSVGRVERALERIASGP